VKEYRFLCSVVLCLGLSLTSARPEDSVCVLHLESPLYDPLARQTRVQGDVRIRVRIEATGKVISAQTESGHPLLAREAEKNIQKWLFNPGNERTIEVIYEFRLDEPEIYYDPPSRVSFDLPSRVRIRSNFKKINP